MVGHGTWEGLCCLYYFILFYIFSPSFFPIFIFCTSWAMFCTSCNHRGHGFLAQWFPWFPKLYWAHVAYGTQWCLGLCMPIDEAGLNYLPWPLWFFWHKPTHYLKEKTHLGGSWMMVHSRWFLSWGSMDSGGSHRGHTRVERAMAHFGGG